MTGLVAEFRRLAVDSRSVAVLLSILIALLCATILAWHVVKGSSSSKIKERFELQADYLVDLIEVRFNTYEQVLRGGVGLFHSSDSVSRDEWKTYIDVLSLDDYFPGFLAVGYSEWIGGVDNIPLFEKRLQSEGLDVFSVRPREPQRENYTAVTYLEPFNERSQKAVGYDMFSNEVRRTAMQSAIDTGKAALTGRVDLVQEKSDNWQAGLLLYLPVYANEDQPQNVKGRRNQLVGFVYSAFRAGDLMEGLLKGDIYSIGFKVYDQDASSENSLLYDGHKAMGLADLSDTARYTTSRKLTVAGRQWTIQVASTPVFELTYETNTAAAVLSIGILLSLLIGAISWMLLSAHLRVKNRTIELRNIENVNDQLKEATRVAQSANLAKSSFLAAMSHEIRTPMNGVVGMVEVLINESPHTQQAISLQIVLDSASSLLGIIDDILDFSKIEAGYLSLENTDEILADVIESVVRSIVPHALGKNVNISLYVDPALPTSVSVDAVRLRQILNNLIGNAIKFSGSVVGSQGKVDVRATLCAKEPHSLKLDVIDDGIGIEASAIDQIFDHFVQAESSTTRRFGGSGLGLAICKRLIKLMDGEISVASEPGKGSVFTVTLPLAAPEVALAKQYDDLSGIYCEIISNTTFCANDVQSYIIASGATVSVKSPSEISQAAYNHDLQPLVLLGTEADVRSAVSNRYKDHPRLGCIVLYRNVGGIASISRHIEIPLPSENSGNGPTNSTSVPLDGIRRSDLIAATAYASGKSLQSSISWKSSSSSDVGTSSLDLSKEEISNYSLLVAEDDPINQKVLQKQLSLLGFSAEFASNGHEALILWRSKPFNALITDLHMPVLDGYQLTNAIREEESDSERIPIIALTANANREDIERARLAGIDQYLTKPIRLALLKQALEKIVVDSLSHVETAEIQVEPAQPVDVLFDPDTLHSLLGDDQEEIAEFLAQFIAQLDVEKNALLPSITSNDKETVRAIAHRYTSSSRSVGANKLGAVFSELEEASNDDSYTLSEEDTDRLTSTISATKAAIRAVNSSL